MTACQWMASRCSPLKSTPASVLAAWATLPPFLAKFDFDLWEAQRADLFLLFWACEKWCRKQTTCFRSDLLGRMLRRSDASSSYSFTLDALGRTTEIDNLGTAGLPRVVLDQEFDAVGNRTALSAEVNSTADFANSYSIDLLSRWTSVTQTGQAGVNTVADKRVDSSTTVWANSPRSSGSWTPAPRNRSWPAVSATITAVV